MSTNPGHGQLSALVTLISDATKVVEAHFAKTSKPYVPSLDDTEPHPMDIMSDSMELRIAIQTIEGACAQLSATVARPAHTILNKTLGVRLTSQVSEPACLDIVLAYKIPDILQQQPHGMHCSEIAKKTGLHEPKIERIMRLLATKHVFRETSEGVFVNNRLSVQLLSANPLTKCIRYNTQEVSRAVPYFLDVLGDKDWGHSNAPNKTAFNKQSGYTKTLFDYYSGTDSVEGAEFGARFGLGMVGWGLATEGSTVIYEFPWREMPRGTTIVDVGSGVGAVTMGLAKKYPSLHLTLQDLPERMLQAKNEVWPKECPDAIAEKRVHFEPIDFFTQSPLPGADIYYLKNILHDWEDGRCVTILSNVRKAMGPQSRLLIHEYIIQKANRLPEDKSFFKQAPEPLLPNYGVGRLRIYAVDMHMMIMINSIERTLQAFIKLGDAAGLKFIKVWDLGETSIVELRLPETTREGGKL